MQGSVQRTHKPLKGFENVSRFWDGQRQTYMVKVKPGEYYVAITDEPIITTLGSCIAVCVREKRFGIGGMNHFMLPKTYSDLTVRELDSGSARYGNFAMEHLINTLFSHGARRQDLEFKVFGGAAVLESDTRIGQSNIDFVRRYMAKEGYQVVSEDLGGEVARKLMYYPLSGRAMLKHMGTERSVINHVIKEEESHLKSLSNPAKVTGDIELF